MSVGGTSLRSDVQPLHPADEQVWNDGEGGGAGGGGISNSWPSPSWQADSGVPGTQDATGRLVPDVSASADENHGVTIYSTTYSPGPRTSLSAPSNSGWSTIGGTSVAAPIWAAAVTDIASAQGVCSGLPVSPGGRDLGFVAPELYAAASSAYSSTFNDITRGNNDAYGLKLGYLAQSGFNLASGLGSPIVTASGGGGLASTLCAIATNRAADLPKPLMTSIGPTNEGPTSGGNLLTLSGSGFQPAAGAQVKVEFGAAQATVDSVTPSAVTVTAPVSPLPPSSSPGGSGGLVTVAVTVSDQAGSQTSPVSAATTYEYVSEPTAGSPVASVAGIGPSGGNSAGGNTVSVFGSGFSASGVSGVYFGGVASPSFHVVRSDEIEAVAPTQSSATVCSAGSGFDPAAVCQVQVVVTTARGASATEAILPPQTGNIVFGPQGVPQPVPGYEDAPASSEYDYAPTPYVASVTPDPAKGTGDEPVVIAGSGFSILTFGWVNFGPPKAIQSAQTKILDLSSTSITIAPPTANVDGAPPETLRGGVSVDSLAGLSDAVPFSYAGIPDVTSLEQLGGPESGGRALRIKGAGLSDVTSVKFIGETQNSAVSVASGASIEHRAKSQLTVVVPPGHVGPVAVVACSANGCSSARRSVDTYVYFGSHANGLAGMSPESGPASGGSIVVLYGDQVGREPMVRFGSSSATVVYDSKYPRNDPYITAVVAPPGRAAGRVAVVVRVGGQADRFSLRGVFRYLPSAPSPPRSVLAKGVGGSVLVSWLPPASDGGSRVTAYSVVATARGLPSLRVRVSAVDLSVRLVGVVSGRRYEISVAALNAGHGAGHPAKDVLAEAP